MSGEVALSDIDAEDKVEKGAKAEKGGCCSGGYFKRSYQFGIDDIGLPLIRAAVAELLGTFFLILFCVGAANGRILKDLGENSPAYYLAIAISFGLGIGAIVHILADVSGGHVNPAVTLALLMDKRISLIGAIVYMIAQFGGGFLGAGVLWAMCNQGGLVETVNGKTVNAIAGANSYDTEVLNGAQAFFIEVLGTMFLVLTVLATIEERRNHAPSYQQPLAIGIAILIMHIWMIPYTNCAINPVRGLVWNIVSGHAEAQTLIFLIAPFAGGAIAMPLYNLIFAP